MSINFVRNLASSSYISTLKQPILGINTFQIAAFPSQRELALIKGEGKRKMGWWETERERGDNLKVQSQARSYVMPSEAPLRPVGFRLMN